MPTSPKSMDTLRLRHKFGTQVSIVVVNSERGTREQPMNKIALIGALVCLLLGVLGTLALEFRQRLEVTSTDTRTQAAVVFTGQFNRVNAALELFEDGQITRLFISGVNPGAGIEAETFADQFNLSPRVRQALHTGQITLGERAGSTLENARETAC